MKTMGYGHSHNKDKVEMFLHPEFMHNHMQIRHEHKGNKILFQAFDMDSPMPKTFELDKSEIMSHTCYSDFHKAYEAEWNRLTNK
jgi:hypothetical protein